MKMSIDRWIALAVVATACVDPYGSRVAQLTGNGVIRSRYAYAIEVPPDRIPVALAAVIPGLSIACAELGATVKSRSHGGDGDICELLNVEVDDVMRTHNIDVSYQPVLQRQCSRLVVEEYRKRTDVWPIICWRLDRQ